MSGEEKAGQTRLFQEERSPEQEDQRRLLDLFDLMPEQDRSQLLVDLSMKVLIDVSKSAIPGDGLSVMMPDEASETDPTGFTAEFLSDIRPESELDTYLGDNFYSTLDDAWRRSATDAILGSATNDYWLAAELLACIEAFAEDTGRASPSVDGETLETLILAWRQKFMDSLCRLKSSSVHTPDATENNDLSERLVDLMPRDSMVLDLWGWDIRFEDVSFDGLEEAAFSDGDEQAAHAENLADNFLQWIDQYGIDYNQTGWDSDEDFEAWIRQQCLDFMKKWRENVRREFGK